jgi:uncharacterized SAM-binding protein YcdF (DUF218 family)
MDISDLSKILVRWVEVGNLLTLMLALGIVLQWIGIGRLGLVLTSLAGVSLLAIMLLPIDQWLARPLENRFTRAPWPSRVDGVLVLSAAQQPYISATRAFPVQHLAQGSMAAAAELMRRYPEARLVFTGGSAFRTSSTAADVARGIFDQLGVDQGRAIYESRSRNTFENLLFAKELVQPKAGETWLMVAPALHMVRAMGVAQRLDWPVAPWPTDFQTPGGEAAAARHVSLGRNLPTIDAAVHEWVGLAIYRLTGKTTTLFPAPAEPAGAAR